MASKYANLPDIDTAPDVYETPETPEDQRRRRPDYEVNSDDEFGTGEKGGRRDESSSRMVGNENIDESRLPGRDALGKRFGARASKTYTLYPTASRPRLPALPSTSLPSDVTVYDPSPSKVEHPRARLRRLRYEMEELEAELAADEEEEEEDAGGVRERDEGLAAMLRELKALKVGLGRLDGMAGMGERQAEKGWERKLISLEGREGDDSVKSGEGTKAEGRVARRAGLEKEDSTADLDRRLAELEQLVGVQAALMEDPSALPTPLLPTLTKLDHLLTLLTQPRHLDAISRRIKLLLTDLDRAQSATNPNNNPNPPSGSNNTRRSLDPSSSSSSSSSPPESSSSTQLTSTQSQKLDSLFSLLPRLTPLLPLLPHLLTRLHSLSSLHASASSFNSTLDTLSTSTASLQGNVKDLGELVGGLEKGLRENEVRVGGNVRALGGRVDDLLERLERLKGEGEGSK